MLEAEAGPPLARRHGQSVEDSEAVSACIREIQPAQDA